MKLFSGALRDKTETRTKTLSIRDFIIFSKFLFKFSSNIDFSSTSFLSVFFSQIKLLQDFHLSLVKFVKRFATRDGERSRAGDNEIYCENV